MGSTNDTVEGPDLAQGVAYGDLKDGEPLLGHVGDEAVILVRRGEAVFAVGATCSHYGGPLAEGLVVGDTVRCPWHHAAFCLRTGVPLRAPALNPVDCWDVRRDGDRVKVAAKREAFAPPKLKGDVPASVVIVGGGAAGAVAAETLRREGYEGPITILSADDAPPCDRPNLSKDYLAGNAPEEWIPLRPAEFHQAQKIDLQLKARVSALDVDARMVTLEDGRKVGYGALLLATGAEPIRLPTPGADQPHVHTLRSLADSRAIIAAAEKAKSAVVIGASFIGLEVAASLRTRGLDVHVVAPEEVPMAKVLGPDLGRMVQAIHTEKGVQFHLGQTVQQIGAGTATLSGGDTVKADLVVMGVGVRPVLALAEQAGLAVDRGLVVNAQLRTSAPGVFAAGDIVRWPDPHTGEKIRVEHWVVAERQGQTAARNILGKAEPFDAVPFFWSQHYDVAIHYTGHAESWDAIEVEGDIAAHDCKVSYRRGGKLLAVATVGRDAANLAAERDLEGSRA
ncbi:FAD-dependent oxidoreductase [Phenylobacterium sp.]|jgi:NADPH-dependent 2,4-dienoyl-CoA reductase/sulfur reductase-like enzyme/nitrite reductase/ring-hydroxylating ferredoxin subunit|uniref:FAD-dependent oxidoreductase n=1 Tax=Phenylobacterium sp. TaxID=1871053 RepID=UPI002F3ECC8E